ncbi:acetyl xylan esterase [Microbacterium sp. Root53]|uniref:acetylxylan esterase n=1 Tax=Microbacterium sp. Root53 TaxID=1736553 RepID=UPI0006F570F7|nr:acetylxylan esterase [Microbacterium sp. Root53]KQZ05094.1 acetyl xylan esterase [Microbacterium sp. Root53]
MALYDLPLDDLRAYAPDVACPDDFDEFWAGTLAETRAAAWDARVERVDNALDVVDTSDVTFSGYAGDPIRAWWHVPAGRQPRAVVVEFIGYSGGRGLAHEVATWPLAGYAHLVVDTRGQGWGHWRSGDTADPHGTGSAVPGVMTQGIEDPATYYYRRVYADAVRAVDTARALAPGIPLFVTGGSQGGGISIAAAALADDVAGALPDVPFLCHFARATTITDARPYKEIGEYLAGHRGRVERVYRTLSYFDGVNMARRAAMPTLFSVALMDVICPPSTVFAAYNAWGGEDRRIEVYPFNDHEGGGAFQRRAQLDWLADRLR